MQQPFRLPGCQWVGFDLDHTLIQYKLDTLLPFVAECFVNYLVEQEHYDRSIFDSISWRFGAKGLVIDRTLGNLLKLDENKCVSRMTHGTRICDATEIATVYPGPLEFDGISSARFWPMTTYFEVALGPLFAVMVDADDKDSGKHASALYNALVFNFSRWDSGWYFDGLKRDPGKYIFTLGDVEKWLHEMKRQDIKLFLLTNSLPEYTDLLLTYGFGGPHWTELFDLIICYARKPVFFSGASTFVGMSFVIYVNTIICMYVCSVYVY